MNPSSTFFRYAAGALLTSIALLYGCSSGSSEDANASNDELSNGGGGGGGAPTAQPTPLPPTPAPGPTSPPTTGKYCCDEPGPDGYCHLVCSDKPIMCPMIACKVPPPPPPPPPPSCETLKCPVGDTCCVLADISTSACVLKPTCVPQGVMCAIPTCPTETDGGSGSADATPSK